MGVGEIIVSVIGLVAFAAIFTVVVLGPLWDLVAGAIHWFLHGPDKSRVPDREG